VSRVSSSSAASSLSSSSRRLVSVSPPRPAAIAAAAAAAAAAFLVREERRVEASRDERNSRRVRASERASERSRRDWRKASRDCVTRIIAAGGGRAAWTVESPWKVGPKEDKREKTR